MFDVVIRRHPRKRGANTRNTIQGSEAIITHKNHYYHSIFLLKAVGREMDFHNVPPVDVKVRDLSLSIERSIPLLEKLHLRRRPQTTEEKRILQKVSLDVVAGSLMAIIGASGSGKVPPLEDRFD